MAKKKSPEIQHGENIETVALELYENKIPEQLIETIQNSGLELTKAEKYASGYAHFMGEVLTQAKLLKGLDKTSAKDAAIAKRVSLDLGKICSRLTDKKKADKELILVETRLIDGLFNVAESTARLTQADANAVVDYLPGLERERIALLATARLNELAEYGADKSYLPLDTMTDEQYTALLEDTKLAFNARKEHAEREERERIEREEKAAQEQREREEAEQLRIQEQERELAELKAQREAEAAERERLHKEAQERVEGFVAELIFAGFEEEEASWSKGGSWYLTYDQLSQMTTEEFTTAVDKIEAWNKERLAKEAEECRLNEQLAKEREEALVASREKERLNKIEQEKLAAKAKEEKERAEKAEAQLLAKKEAEAKAEKERIAKEKAAKLAPDKEKLTVLYNALDTIQFPDVTSAEAKEITKLVNNTLAQLKKDFVELAKKMV